MILYEHPLSPYAQKVRIALREKGIRFETRMPQRMGSGAGNPHLEERNPRFEIPLLVDGEFSVFDSTVMLEYLEDKFPSPPLRPDSPKQRARVRMIEDVCDTHYEAINWGLSELKFFGRGDEELREVLRERAGVQTGHLQRWLGSQLGARAWFNGEHFGYGDLCVVPFAAMSEMFGLAPQAASPLSAWLTRVRQRPSVSETIAEAMAAVPAMGGVSKRVRDGTFKRQYRDHRLEWMIRSGGLKIVTDGLGNGDIRFTDTQRFAPQPSAGRE